MPPVKDRYGLPPLKKPYAEPPRPDGDGFMRGVIWGALVIAIAFILVLALGLI